MLGLTRCEEDLVAACPMLLNTLIELALQPCCCLWTMPGKQAPCPTRFDVFSYIFMSKSLAATLALLFELLDNLVGLLIGKKKVLAFF